MPKHAAIPVPERGFALLANGVDGALIVNDGALTWYLVPTASAAEPTEEMAGRIPFLPGAVMFPDQAFADIWPGMTVSHVWAYADVRGAHAQVSHA